MSKSRKILNMRSSVRTLSVKCYDEQMPQGWDDVKNNIKAIDKSVWQVLGICHDRDYVGDNFWTPAVEKKHYHIIVRVLNGKNARVEQILRTLGIVYRPVEDKSLWENHGVETCADYTAMAVYLTHDTEQAILDGKEQYELEELVSNLSIEEIRQIREGYTRVSESCGRVTEKTLVELKQVAYDLGYNLGDFSEWYKSLPLQVLRSNNMRVFEKMYHLGVVDRASKREEVGRLCVFVCGETSMGKTYAAMSALEHLGVEYLPVNGGGTGKFDALKPTHGGIIIDDDVCPNLLNMSDSYYCPAYRRGSNNPYWVGKYFIVTSNLSFDDWVESCGIKTREHKRAMRKRFYICHVENVGGYNMLKCDSMESRNSPEKKKEVFAMYQAFRDYYNVSLEQYQGFEYDMSDYVNVDGELYASRKIAEAEKEKKAIEPEVEEIKAMDKRRIETGEQNGKLAREDNEYYEYAVLYWRLSRNLSALEIPTSEKQMQEIRDIKMMFKRCGSPYKAYYKYVSPLCVKHYKNLIQERELLKKEEKEEVEEMYDYDGEFDADTVAEFEESIEEPDKYAEEIVLRWYV